MAQVINPPHSVQFVGIAQAAVHRGERGPVPRCHAKKNLAVERRAVEVGAARRISAPAVVDVTRRLARSLL
jgi:hypothetical protein